MKRRRSRKRPRRREDRISHLPDDVLVRILSLLEAKDAVRTTSLSREWRWRRRMRIYVDNLSFHFRSASQIRWYYVNRILDLHRAPKITRFSLRIQHGECQYRKLARLLRFAVMRQVEVFNLYLPAHPPLMMSRFVLPEFLFSCDSLRELTTDGWDLSLGRRVNWGSLRVLDVGFASLLGIENLLSGCPSLESLTLRFVFVHGDGHNIDITLSTLKKLVIQQPRSEHYNNVSDPKFCVATPQLEELELLGCWHSITCKLVDVPSLVQARLDFFFQTVHSNDEMCENAEKELREKIRQIMSLKCTA